MADPRLPVLASGDPTYSGGNPVYDSGDDLGTRAVTANFHGDTSVASFILDQVGVRMSITSDSQWSGGNNRGYLGVVGTWPVDWSTLWAPPTANDPFSHNRSINHSGYLLAGQWNDTTTTINGTASGGETDVADIYTSEDIGDPSEIPMPFGWFDDPNTGSGFGTVQITQSGFLDPTRFDEPGGTLLRFKLFWLSGGTGTLAAPTALRLRNELYNAGGSASNTNFDVADTTAVSGLSKITLDATNNEGAILSVLTTTALTNYPCADDFKPRLNILENGEDFDNLSAFALGGQCQRMTDASTPEDNISVNLVRYASGMNPWMWISGAATATANKTAHGSNATIRQWLWIASGNPNVLVYSYGHNSITRNGTGFKAESTFQADLFDLIYQDASDYYTNNGSWPRVLIVAPWRAGNMNSTRHAEMMGVVDACRATGIPTLGASLYNFFGGASFTGAAPSNSSDYENETTFELDGDGNPAGDGVHPNSLDDAKIAWYGLYRILEEAAASSTSGQRSRDRSRER